MVGFFQVAVLAAAGLGVTGAIVAGPLDGGLDLQARHDATVTVTVTATTCPDDGSAPPTGYPVGTTAMSSTATAVSTGPSGAGGYSFPPLIPSSVASMPPVVTPSSVAVPPTASETPVVSTVPVETTPVETTAVISTTAPATDITTTAIASISTTMFPSTSTSATTTPSVTASIPPAVGGAHKIESNVGALALLAVVALF